MTEKTKQINVRLPELSQDQIEAIQEATGLGQTQIIVLAVTRLYEQLDKITPKKPR